MLLRSHRFLSALAVLVLAFGLCPARADNVETVKEKLYQAKKEYDGEARKFRKTVGDWFDKRDTEARNGGNKKLVDQVKTERETFEKSGGLPPKFPSMLQEQIKSARVKLERAYTTAIKVYVQAKEDKLAEATEQEQQKFVVDSALSFGKRTYLTQLKPFDLQVLDGWYELDSKRAKMDGEIVPHSIFLHAKEKSFSSASFNLGGKATIFRAVVGIPKQEFPGSETPLTFEVLGDGKSLWKSEPVQKLESFQTCTVRVDKVKILSIRVHCPGKHDYAHSTWFAPFIVE